MTRLQPRVHPLARALIDEPDGASALADRYGSPLHVVFPDVVTENVAQFRRRLDDARLPYRIFYAHKANQSRALVRAAFDTGIDIDVASDGELTQALAAGFAPDRIEATGPKGETLLRRLIALPGLVINVDNLWELGRISDLAERPVPVLLRLSAGRRVSRFGLAPDHFPAAYRLILDRPCALRLIGVSFHLDTSDPVEKVQALTAALHLIETAHAHGLAPGVLDIGGGYRQAYLADPDEFDDYVRELRHGLLGQGPRLNWGGYTFGYQIDGGRLRGTPVFHRYDNSIPGAALLGEMLDATADDGRAVARLLQDSLLEIWLEPGKALIDHAGLTIATVEFTKETTDGDVLAVLDLSRDTITPSDQEVMLDPELIHRSPPGDHDRPAGVFLAGRLCLERDMVSNHLVRLARRPEPGDLLVFVNTAAYQMDLSASEALMHPRAPKVAARRRDGRFTVTADGDEPCSTTT